MRRRTLVLVGLAVVAIVLCVVPARVSAWWPDGHALVDGAALEVVGADMPTFLRSAGKAVSLHAAMPDVWTESGLPRLRAAERHNHFIDLELLAGEQPPPTKAEYLALLARLGVAQEVAGTLPYAICETYERLVVAFVVCRAMPDDEAARAEALYLSGILSHYAADAVQPLHTTVHFDGRLRDDGTSPRTGIHLKVDALPANAGLARAEVAAGIRVEAVEDVFGFSLAAIRQAHALVDRVYELEARLPPAEGGRPNAGLDPEVRQFALERSRAAAGVVSALWCSAWRASANVTLPEWFGPFAGRLDEARAAPGGCAAP